MFYFTSANHFSIQILDLYAVLIFVSDFLPNGNIDSII